MSNSESIGNLIKALATVSRAVGSLEPDKRNKEQNYDYISADKILQRIGGAMAENGIVIVPAVVNNHYETVTYTNRYGEKSRIDAVAEFMMTVSHDSGEHMQIPWVGYGTDYVTPDKAIYKAITSGHKYFLMKLFNVGVGNEDGEHEVGEEMDKVTSPKPRQPPTEKPIDLPAWYKHVLDKIPHYKHQAHVNNTLKKLEVERPTTRDEGLQVFDKLKEYAFASDEEQEPLFDEPTASGAYSD